MNECKYEYKRDSNQKCKRHTTKGGNYCKQHKSYIKNTKIKEQYYTNSNEHEKKCDTPAIIQNYKNEDILPILDVQNEKNVEENDENAELHNYIMYLINERLDELGLTKKSDVSKTNVSSLLGGGTSSIIMVLASALIPIIIKFITTNSINGINKQPEINRNINTRRTDEGPEGIHTNNDERQQTDYNEIKNENRVIQNPENTKTIINPIKF
jgi:hypothetical protein